MTGLRSYQQTAVDAWLATRRGTILAATGSGKTHIGADIVRRTDGRVLWLVPTIPLTLQTRDRLVEYLGEDVGVWYGDEKDPRHRVTVMTYASAVLHRNDLWGYKLIVYDEVDHAPAEVLPGSPIRCDLLGLTATLDPKSPAAKRVVQSMPVVYNLDPKSARAVGALAPVEVIHRPVELTPQERQAYNEWDEKRKASFTKLRTWDFGKIAQMATSGNSVAVECLRLTAKLRALLAESTAKAKEVLDISEAHVGERILLFSETIQSIEALRQYLEVSGLEVGVYHSKMGRKDREDTLAEWGERFNLLLCVHALERGLDVPECGVGIVMASSKKSLTLIQRVGRLVRPLPGKTAKVFVIAASGTSENGLIAAVRKAAGN